MNNVLTSWAATDDSKSFVVHGVASDRASISILNIPLCYVN